jgi:hypothetical protein
MERHIVTTASVIQAESTAKRLSTSTARAPQAVTLQE